ncbi:MAG TPA: glycosyltransferase [Nitrososphaerales archaeon]|nr:glycosyltransferase [Nitrososphaerales archaeon]
MPQGRVTIVVPTHNRSTQVSALLESIKRNFTPEIDSIIVVDDSETPVDLVSKFPELNLRHLLLHKRIFISKAKNIGWREAKTPYVFFIDDDNIVEEATITGTLDAIAHKPGAAAIMPAVLYKSQPDLVWVYAAPFTSPPDFELLGRNLPRNPSLEQRYYNTDALPNASIIRREALEQVGGFNERLVVNSSMNIAVKLKSLGWKVFAYTGSFIYHDVEPPGKLGWWAAHGWADPKRVRYEMSDWFIIMRTVREKQKFLMLRSILDSARFVLPNSLAYLVRGRARRKVIVELCRGYIDGIVESWSG